MDPTFVALIVPVWNWLAAGQNAVLFGIVIAGFANVVVLFNGEIALYASRPHIDVDGRGPYIRNRGNSSV